MAVLFLFMGAIALGFVLILLIGVTAPRPERVDLKEESGGSPLVDLDAEQLGRLIAALLERMGLEIERCQGGKNEILEILAINPAPVTGGKILVHCLPPPESGKLDGRAVGAFIRAVRSAYVSKGLLFTTGTFTPDARLESEDAPIELFDRDRIMAMVNRHFESEDAAALVHG